MQVIAQTNSQISNCAILKTHVHTQYEILNKEDNSHKIKRTRSEGKEVCSDYDSHSEDESYSDNSNDDEPYTDNKSNAQYKLKYEFNVVPKVQYSSVVNKNRGKPSLFKRIKKFFKRQCPKI